MDEGLRREDLAIHVKRQSVFEDSFREIHRRTPEEWKHRFYIVFEGNHNLAPRGLGTITLKIIKLEITSFSSPCKSFFN